MWYEYMFRYIRRYPHDIFRNMYVYCSDYRTVPGEVYEASEDYCTVRARLLYGTRTAGQEANKQ